MTTRTATAISVSVLTSVQRGACPSLFDGEAGAWRGRGRRGGGGWSAVAAAKAAGGAAAPAARGAYIGSRRTRCRHIRGRKSAVSSERMTERQWRGSGDCNTKPEWARNFCPILYQHSQHVALTPPLSHCSTVLHRIETSRSQAARGFLSRASTLFILFYSPPPPHTTYHISHR